LVPDAESPATDWFHRIAVLEYEELEP